MFSLLVITIAVAALMENNKTTTLNKEEPVLANMNNSTKPLIPTTINKKDK